MPSESELAEAVERLRRVKAGEDVCKVYATDNYSLACNSEDNDRLTVSDAYLELGTRQPVEQVTWSDDGTMTLVVRGHVEPVRNGDSIVYIQATEVPNAGK